MLKAAELSEVIITRLAAEIRGAMERARAGLAPTAGKSSRETLSTVVNRIVDAFAEEPSSLQSSPVDAPSGPGSTPNTSSRPSNRPPHSKRGSGIWDSFNWFAPSGGTDGSPQGDDAGGQINKADFTPDAVAQFLSNFAGNGGAAMTSENGSTTSGGGYQSSGQGDPNAPGLDWNNMQIFGGSGVTDWCAQASVLSLTRLTRRRAQDDVRCRSGNFLIAKLCIASNVARPSVILSDGLRCLK